MESAANTMRFTSTAILLKQPFLVILTVVFVLALLSTQFDPNGSSSGGVWGWLGLVILIAVWALIAWMLCVSEEIVIDPATRRVTQWYRFLKCQTAKNEWDFSDFIGVCVERKAGKSQSASTSPGSGGTYTSVKTTYTFHYTLGLLRADTVIAAPDRQINVPHYPLELPMEERNDPLSLEAAARQLARIGGWPANPRERHREGGNGDQRVTHEIPRDDVVDQRCQGTTGKRVQSWWN